jgi:(S)-2-hydroxy-acid oxidase
MANRAPALDAKVFSIADLKFEANKSLQPAYRDFYNGGAMELITYDCSKGCFHYSDELRLRDNEDAYNKFKIRPRVLRDVSNVDTSSTIFGRKVGLDVARNCNAHFSGRASVWLQPHSNAKARSSRW